MKSVVKGVIFILVIVAIGAFIEGRRVGLPPDQLSVSVILTPILSLGAGIVFLFLIISALMVVGWWPTPQDRDEQERFEKDFPGPKE